MSSFAPCSARSVARGHPAAAAAAVSRAGTGIASRSAVPSSKPRVCKRSGVASPNVLAKAAVAAAAAAPTASASAPSSSASGSSPDPWIVATLAAVDSGASGGDKLPECLAALRAASRAALLSPTTRMPTTRVEAFRFTDISPVLERPAGPVVGDSSSEAETLVAAAVAAHALEGAAATLVVVDGAFRADLSTGSTSNKRAVIGGVEQEGATEALKLLGRASRERGGPFAQLNGGVASSAAVVAVAAEVALAGPVHVLYVSTADSPSSSASSSPPSISAPRLLVSLGPGAEATVVEEFCGVSAASSRDGGASASTSSSPSTLSSSSKNSGHRRHSRLNVPVAEFFLSEGSTLSHSYVELEARGTWHARETLVDQAEGSSYALTEARAGGAAAISRADVDVRQLGPSTRTSMRSFILAGEDQLVDLHTRLSLDFPDGEADQLHKAIAAAATSRAVFDGGVRVGRAAQRTNAQQLSRNLLLSRRATVNVKPNLQIVADDVKCTHGCAVSDLEEDQMFYFKSRGIDGITARRVLVQSFGAEVTAALPGKDLRRRVDAAAGAALSKVKLEAAAAASEEEK